MAFHLISGSTSKSFCVLMAVHNISATHIPQREIKNGDGSVQDPPSPKPFPPNPPPSPAWARSLSLLPS